jgi:hypothetical protein
MCENLDLVYFYLLCDCWDRRLSKILTKWNEDPSKRRFIDHILFEYIKAQRRNPKKKPPQTTKRGMFKIFLLATRRITTTRRHTNKQKTEKSNSQSCSGIGNRSTRALSLRCSHTNPKKQTKKQKKTHKNPQQKPKKQQSTTKFPQLLKHQRRIRCFQDFMSTSAMTSHR